MDQSDKGKVKSASEISALKEKIKELEKSEEKYRSLGKEIENRLDFEKLLSELSAAFVNLPADKTEKEITAWLKKVVEVLGVERSSLIELNGGKGKTRIIADWALPGVKPLPANMDLEGKFPWVHKKIQNDEIVHLASLRQLPQSASADRQSFQNLGIKAHVAIPLSAGGAIIGALTFTSLSKERDWSQTDIDRLQLLGRIFTNVILRRQNETLLNDSISRYKALFESASDAIFIMEDDLFIECNRMTRDIFGCESESEIVGHTPYDFSPPLQPDGQDSKKKSLDLIRGIKAGQSKRFPWLHVRKDGTEFDVEVSLTRLKIQHQTLLLAIVRDVTVRNKAIEELEKTKALLTAAIEQSPAGILIADAPDVKIRVANSAALGIRGESVEPLTEIPLNLHPANWQTYYPSGDSFAPEDLPLSRAVLKGETSQNIEAIIRRQDGSERWVLANASPVRDTNGNIVAGVVVFSDITNRKIALQKIEDGAEKLKEERQALLEKNIALKQVLDHIENEKDEYKQEINANIHDLIYPVVKELRKTKGYLGKKKIDMFETNLMAIVEKDLNQFRLNYAKLTSRELDVCELIKNGMSSKEIAESLSIAPETVHKHRESIRRKLQLKNKEINLSAYLRSKLT